MINHWEFWAIDENGQKYNDVVKTKLNRAVKIRNIISKVYKINIDKCIDFGMRKLP
jgi:hypothetical protein